MKTCPPFSFLVYHLLGQYAQRFNKRHQRRGHLFQERFKNVLVEEESYGLELSRYIALNPVRAGLVGRPEQWEWGSYAARAGFVKAPDWLTLDPLLSHFGPERASQQTEYRDFVLLKIGATDDLMERVTAAIYLGRAEWIDRVQPLLDEQERSEEHPRAQVHPGRPDLGDVVDAVAKTFDTTQESIRTERGTLERRLVAWFAFEEGLIPLRRIARELGVTSAGGISRQVSRCRRELRDDPEIRAIAEACRGRMRRRPPPFLFPPQVPPLTARRYHRAPSRSRR